MENDDFDHRPKLGYKSPCYDDDCDDFGISSIASRSSMDDVPERSGITGEQLAAMLEHDAALSLDELVDGTFEDCVARAELEFNFGAGADTAFHKIPLPERVPTLTGMSMTTQVTYNFSRWVARDEIKRFARRLDNSLRNKYLHGYNKSLQMLEENNTKLARRLDVVQALLGVLLFLILVSLSVALSSK